jgi:hypothetical protein
MILEFISDEILKGIYHHLLGFEEPNCVINAFSFICAVGIVLFGDEYNCVFPFFLCLEPSLFHPGIVRAKFFFTFVRCPFPAPIHLARTNDVSAGPSGTTRCSTVVMNMTFSDSTVSKTQTLDVKLTSKLKVTRKFCILTHLCNEEMRGNL